MADADRAGEIIDRIREQIKKAPPHKRAFNAAINKVIILARSATNRSGVLVEMRLADGLFHVAGDRVQMQEVLLNLILNAVEGNGARRGGARELMISTEQDRTGVVVAVRDSRPGIDPTHLERVFQPFYTTQSWNWDGAYRYAGPSSMLIRVSCRRQTGLAAPCFASLCPTPKERSRVLSRISGRESRVKTPCEVLLIQRFAKVPNDSFIQGAGRDRARRESEKDLSALRERFGSLSPRERETMMQVARGRLSKQIAHDIGVAEATVKVHRSRAMQKMQAGSLPELGRMADRLKLVPDTPRRS